VAQAPVAELLTRLWTDYAARGGVVHQDFVFHCLVLRLLLTRYGSHLSQTIYGHLFRMHQESHRQAWHAREEALREEFRQLIMNRLQVDIREQKPISGGMRAEKVYEVEFIVRLPGYPEGRVDVAYESRPGRIIVKTGRYADLSRAAEEYKRLPPNLRPLFANHGHDPIPIPTPQGMRGYLIMEDLRDKQTLEAFLMGMDKIALTETHKTRVDRVVMALGEALRKVHGAEPFRKARDSLSGDHLARLYVGPMENAAMTLSRGKLRLQTESQKWEYQGRLYHPLGHYLRVIERHNRILRPPTIGLVHGDCHTRNIMVDEATYRIIFIDLDHMNQNDDYIDDYAILLEDTCLYRYLRSPELTGHIPLTMIRHQRRRDTQVVVVEEAGYMGRALPHRFQTALFVQIEQEAQRMHDGEYWRPRLWLATSARLLMLAARVQSVESALLLYAEAIRLLGELEAHLDEADPLPALLFDAGQRWETERPLDPLTALAERIRQDWPMLDVHIQTRRCELRTSDGRLVALLFRPPERRDRMRLALALSPAVLADLVPTVQPFASGALQAVLDLPEGMEATANLITACLQRVVSQGMV
jgi:hypothetical protein